MNDYDIYKILESNSQTEKHKSYGSHQDAFFERADIAVMQGLSNYLDSIFTTKEDFIKLVMLQMKENGWKT